MCKSFSGNTRLAGFSLCFPVFPKNNNNKMFNIVDGEPFVKVINYPQNANKQNTKKK